MKEEHVAPGVSVVGFDSMEEMLAYMADEEQRLEEMTILPAQRTITWGEYCVRLQQQPGFLMSIWGEITTPDKYIELTRHAGAELAEAEGELRSLQKSHENGWRYGRWYSQVLLEGEYGSAHIASCWPVTKEDFERARQNHWELDAETYQRIVNETDAELKAVGEPGLGEEGNADEEPS